MFEAPYRDLSDENPEWGRIAVLPWDTEIFGFAVADYQPGELKEISRARAQVCERLKSWAGENAAELISCSVTSGEPLWRALLPRLGFTYVDSTLNYAMKKLQDREFPRLHKPVRLATAEDQPGVERICEIGFRAGRYHADARFPLELAKLRYRRWLANEFTKLGDDNRIYVSGAADAILGFTHARVHGSRAYITIGGSDPAVHSGVIPYEIFTSTVESLRDSGVRRAESKLSAGNTPMMNLAIFAGARFSAPENVYHWHAADSPHLLQDDRLFG